MVSTFCVAKTDPVTLATNIGFRVQGSGLEFSL
jgi:hypothetical protein